MTTSATSDHAVMVTLRVNGAERSVAVPTARTLADLLRFDLDLTGTKTVCEQGNCGACTVLIDDLAVCSCLILAVECEGQEVDTVEGLADGATPAPLQQAFVECDALQCGFCTSGQLMSLEGLRRSGADPTDHAIELAITGNLCRCGAYNHIRTAARQALGPAGETGLASGQGDAS